MTADIKKPLIEAAQSLLLHKFRSFLSMLGIIFGVAAFISMLSVGEGAKREAIRQIELLGTRNIIIKAAQLSEAAQAEAAETLSPGLTYTDLVRLKSGCPFGRELAAIRDVEADILVERKALDISVAGVEPGFFRVNNLRAERGRLLADHDLIRHERVCVLGAEAAQKMFGYSAAALDRKIIINYDWYSVVGILENRAMPGKRSAVAAISHRPINNQVYIPLPNAMMMESAQYMGSAGLSEIIMQVDRSAEVPSYARVVKGVLERTHRGVADYQLVIPQQILLQKKRSQHIFNIVLGSIAAISLVVGGIGIMNIMLATISERTSEIGIRRAVGARQVDILRQFLSETILLAAAGGALGVAVGFGLAKAIAIYADWDTIISFKNIIVSLLVSGTVGVFFGLYPAYKASRMDPIEALRFE